MLPPTSDVYWNKIWDKQIKGLPPQLVDLCVTMVALLDPPLDVEGHFSYDGCGIWENKRRAAVAYCIGHNLLLPEVT